MTTLNPKSSALPPTALTIGNFDGCHLGHQALIEVVVDASNRLRLTPSALTFSPRPEAYFRGIDETGRLLFSPEQKQRALEEFGIKHHDVKTFDHAFSQLSAEAFYTTSIREKLRAEFISVGANFRFGSQRQGTAQWLIDRTERDGYTTHICAEVVVDDAAASSSRVRRLLSEGDVDNASRILGRPYLLEGVIGSDSKMGRTLGFPTANLHDIQQLIPAHGVYAGWMWVAEITATSAHKHPPIRLQPTQLWPAVFNIGVRPTVNGSKEVRIEGHLLDKQLADNALYLRRAGFYLAHRIRDEQRFPDLVALKAQIQVDVQRAKTLLNA